MLLLLLLFIAYANATWTSFHVLTDGCFYEWRNFRTIKIWYGVPQGAVLGPLNFFVLPLNSLLNVKFTNRFLFKFPFSVTSQFQQDKKYNSCHISWLSFICSFVFLPPSPVCVVVGSNLRRSVSPDCSIHAHRFQDPQMLPGWLWEIISPAGPGSAPCPAHQGIPKSPQPAPLNL